MPDISLCPYVVIRTSGWFRISMFLNKKYVHMWLYGSEITFWLSAECRDVV